MWKQLQTESWLLFLENKLNWPLHSFYHPHSLFVIPSIKCNLVLISFILLRLDLYNFAIILGELLHNRLLHTCALLHFHVGEDPVLTAFINRCMFFNFFNNQNNYPLIYGIYSTNTSYVQFTDIPVYNRYNDNMQILSYKGKLKSAKVGSVSAVMLIYSAYQHHAIDTHR